MAANYNFGQLSNIFTQAGGNSQLAPIMAAISLDESSGNPSALNTHDTNGQGGTQTSAGLWMISNGTNTVIDSPNSDENIYRRSRGKDYNSASATR